jgi:hypothetical protein
LKGVALTSGFKKLAFQAKQLEEMTPYTYEAADELIRAIDEEIQVVKELLK